MNFDDEKSPPLRQNKSSTIQRSISSKKSKELSKSITSHDGKIKRFEDIDVSTRTVIGISNLRINLNKFFTYVPITEYISDKKKRGRKPKIQVSVNKNNIPNGSIISLEQGVEIEENDKKIKTILLRGISLKPKKKERKTFFLHSVTLVMILDEPIIYDNISNDNLSFSKSSHSSTSNKTINVKVYSNGKFQITGCKSDDSYVRSIIYIYNIIKETEKWTGEKIHYLEKDKNIDCDDKLSIIFNTVMQNMDFNIGFHISRTKLDNFININTNYRSIFDGSLYTCVNIKVNYDNTVKSDLTKITYIEAGAENNNFVLNQMTGLLDKEKIHHVLDNENNTFKVYKEFVPYKFYNDLMDVKEKKKYAKKENHHTFLVFASGSIIMSSQGPDMKRAFYELIDILLNNRKEIEGIDEYYKENDDIDDDEILTNNKSISSNEDYEYYSDEDF
jgi:TATA-box binding protein (TBP) (component of TFIID and TFIIIB)